MNTSENICYKVVNMENDYFVSLLKTDHSCIYKLNEKTIPILGKLFVFINLYEAIKMSRSYENCVIFEGIGENLKELIYVGGNASRDKEFWDVFNTNKFNEALWFYAPEGTYQSDSFTPIKILNKEELKDEQ